MTDLGSEQDLGLEAYHTSQPSPTGKGGDRWSARRLIFGLLASVVGAFAGVAIGGLGGGAAGLYLSGVTFEQFSANSVDIINHSTALYLGFTAGGIIGIVGGVETAVRLAGLRTRG